MSTAAHVSTHRAIPIPDSMDDLLDHTPGELQALYENATAPRLDVIRGDFRGRMLAVPRLSPSAQALLRFAASSRLFPWRRKSFCPAGLDRGEGINRLVSDRLRLFRFRTYLDRSRAGDFDAAHLDYDRAENPRLLRRVKDELRMLRPGLYLGQAYLVLRAPRLLAWFALERSK